MRGKVFWCTQDYIRQGDHPRLCGEKSTKMMILVYSRGSPPPMRGKEFTGDKNKIRHRITPAYAGKRGRHDTARCCDWDHPRLCGEKLCHGVCGRVKLGSPPPMRGKGSGRTSRRGHLRITPAYAGKSGSRTDTFERH